MKKLLRNQLSARRFVQSTIGIAIPAMFSFLAAGAPSFASIPHSTCPEPKLAAQPPVAGVMPGFGHKAHVLLGAAPDYPPYTGWAGTVPDDPTTSGFNVEVGLLAEPICGINGASSTNRPIPCWLNATPCADRRLARVHGGVQQVLG